MWPYTPEESAWLTVRRQTADYPTVSRETIDHYIAKAHRLRAEHYARLGQKLMAPLRRLIARPKPPAAPALQSVQVLHELRTPLTSIRSFSEILRNHPDLTPTQRTRYLDIILAESKRLERVVNEVGQMLRNDPSPGKA